MAPGGAAAVEALRAELALAKEQACISNAAALKAAEELRAEHAARLRSEEKIAEMAVELRDAVGWYELLEKENQTKAADLKNALDSTKDTRSQIRAAREELRQAGEIAAGSPYVLRMKFLDQSMLRWISYGALQMSMLTWRRVWLMRPSYSRIMRITKWRGYSRRNLMLQRAPCP